MPRRTLLLNCTVRTMDPSNPEAGAVGIDGERIGFVGSEEAALVWGGAGARRVDLEGATVLPGFIDCHTHFLSMGVWRGRLDLSRARSLEEALEMVSAGAKRTPKGSWVLGRGWDETRWTEGRFIERAELDDAAPGHPVLLIRVCGHMAVLSTRALSRLARCIGRHAVDRTRGIIVEGALERARRALRPSREELALGLKRAMRAARELGVTSVHDIIDPSRLRTYIDASLEGGLTVRATLHFEGLAVEERARMGPHPRWEGRVLRAGGVKLYADGSLGARTAALWEPYADDPRNRGRLLHPMSRLVSSIKRAEREGIQLLVHAIGDRAIEQVVGAFARALGSRPSLPRPASGGGRTEEGRRGPAPSPLPAPGTSLRHRVEHLELVSRAQLSEMRELGVWASMQPNFIGEWGGPGGMMEARLGGRYERADPLRWVADSGVPLVLGSDCMPFSPLYGVHCAVNAPFQAQRLRVEEALAAYTRAAAASSFEEGLKGAIAEGMAADIAVLSGDPVREKGRIKELRVDHTILSGRFVWGGYGR